MEATPRGERGGVKTPPRPRIWRTAVYARFSICVWSYKGSVDKVLVLVLY